jgi:hypothetical protein
MSFRYFSHDDNLAIASGCSKLFERMANPVRSLEEDNRSALRTQARKPRFAV